MKRSEMLENMINFYIDHSDKIGHGWSVGDFMDNLLTDMEIDGMLPPETKATVGDFKGQFFDQKFIDDHDLKLNKWEPEDE